MESKFVIFVVFAGLAQSSFAQSSTAPYGLSAQDLASRNAILAYQDTAVLAQYDAIDPIFDILESYASTLIDNGLEKVSNDDSSKIGAALVRAKDSLNYFLDAGLIALGDTDCDAIEAARETAHAYLDDVYAANAAALALTVSENYSDIRNQLEVYQDRVQEDLANTVSCIADSIRTCLPISNDAILSEIQLAQNGTLLSLQRATNAIFSAMKVYAAVAIEGDAGIWLISHMEEYRAQAAFELKDEVTYKYAALKTFFLYSKLISQTGIDVATLGRNQYALTVGIHKGLEAMLPVFNRMRAVLHTVELGLYWAGANDYSMSDADQDLTTAKLRAGYAAISSAVLFANPDAAEKIAAINESLNALLAAKAATYYGAIKAAAWQPTGLTNSLAQIEAFRSLSIAAAYEQATGIYELLRRGETWDDASETEFASYENAAPALFETLANSVFDTIVALAKVVDENAVSEDDFSLIDENYDLVFHAVVTLNLQISEAGVVVLKANFEE